MKLAVLGAVTVGIGIALGIPGLVGIGLFWVPMGLLVRAHGQRLQQARDDNGNAAVSVASAGRAAPAISGRMFALGTVLMLAVGVPSLVVGIAEIGIPADHGDWRWLPIAVGGLITGIAVIGGLMYAAGAGVEAATGGVPEIPATLRILSVEETGTFVNERPRLEFVFAVEPEAASGMAPYEVTKKATVPFTAVGSVHVGDGFRATVVGPEHPTTMTIDWDSRLPGGVHADAGQAPAETDTPDVSARLEELEQLRREAKVTDEEYQAQRQRILGSL